MTDGPETPRLKEILTKYRRRAPSFGVQEWDDLLGELSGLLADQIEAGRASAETPRLRALAREAAKSNHASALTGYIKNTGHKDNCELGLGFDVCPHPDCVLVRAGAKEPDMRDCGQSGHPWTCNCYPERSVAGAAPAQEPEAVTTFTPLLWVTMSEQEHYEEYIRIRREARTFEVMLPPLHAKIAELKLAATSAGAAPEAHIGHCVCAECQAIDAQDKGGGCI